MGGEAAISDSDEFAGQFLRESLFNRGTGDPFATDPFATESDITALPDDWSLSPQGFAYIPLIAKLPEVESRAHFLALVERLPTRDESDPFSAFNLSFEEPNYFLEAARELATQIPLTPDEIAQAEAAFARVVTQEEENRWELSESDEE